MENSISNFNLGAAMSQSSALFLRSTFDFSTLDASLDTPPREQVCHRTLSQQPELILT
jgi:hypothetical protein